MEIELQFEVRLPHADPRTVSTLAEAWQAIHGFVADNGGHMPHHGVWLSVKVGTDRKVELTLVQSSRLAFQVGLADWQGRPIVGAPQPTPQTIVTRLSRIDSARLGPRTCLSSVGSTI
ncbi:MAG: hypothetical protein ABIJ46_00725 [bacterium]